MDFTETETGFHLRIGNRTCDKPLSCKDCPLLRKLKIEPDHANFKSILAVGEGPGEDERIKMLPFSGPSGTYLRAVEDEVGVSQYGIAHSNIILCEGGKKLEFDDPAALWATIACCTPLLDAEVVSLSPKLIVPLGNFPKSVFLPEERRGIGSCYANFYPGGKDYYDIMPLHHPAHILRNPKMHEQYMDEWTEVKHLFSEKPGPFVVHDGTLGFLDLIEKEGKAPFVDFETTSYHPWDSGEFTVNYGELYGKPYPKRETRFRNGDIIVMSLCLDGLNSYVYTKSQVRRWLPRLKRVLEKTGVSCHNGQFDVLFLMKYDIKPRLVDDTMHMSYAMDESPRHGLKRLSRRFLGLEDWSLKLEGYPLKSVSYAYIPPKVVKPYCGMDTASGVLLKDVLSHRMDNNDQRLYQGLLMPCANMFLALNYKGIRIDVGRVMDLRHKWMKRRLVVLSRLKDFGLKNWGSSAQVSRALRKLGITESDVYTAKASMLFFKNQCVESGIPRGEEFCSLVLEARDLGKAIDTVLLDILRSTGEEDCRIHPDCKMFATVTGRLVITGPTLLNFPRVTRLANELRECFIPDKGRYWYHRDEKQFEYRTYAAVINDRTFKKLFNEGRDPHTEAALNYLRKKYRIKDPAPIYEAMDRTIQDLIRSAGWGEFTEEEAVGLAKITLTKLEYRTTSEELKVLYREIKRDIRGIMKTVGFGKLYGRGYESVASQLGITIVESKSLLEDISRPWEGYERYVTWIENSLMEDQVLVNPLGRKRRFPVITEENYTECKLQAYNWPIQSTANDLNLLGMVKMYESDYYKHGLIQPFFPIHDAIESQEEHSHAKEIDEWATETLAGIPATVLKVNDLEFKTDVGHGENWAKASMK